MLLKIPIHGLLPYLTATTSRYRCSYVLLFPSEFRRLFCVLAHFQQPHPAASTSVQTETYVFFNSQRVNIFPVFLLKLFLSFSFEIVIWLHHSYDPFLPPMPSQAPLPAPFLIHTSNLLCNRGPCSEFSLNLKGKQR